MTRDSNVTRLAFWTIVVAIAVMALKFVAWRLTGSVALYSDALESIVNVVAGVMAFMAVRISAKPADQDHPHGHHKAEYFSAVAEGVLIVMAAFLIIIEVAGALREPPALAQPDVGLAVNGLAAAINAVWAFLLLRVGKRARSPALVADSRHLFSDVMTSVGVIVGLLAAIATGWHVLDPLLAVAVAMNILWQGWKVMGSSVQGLMDSAVDAEEHMRIRDVISSHSGGAIEVHDLKTRIAGRATFVEFHLVVDADMTVRESHRICDQIEEALKAEIESLRVIIHVEPDDEAKLPPGTSSVPFA